MKEEILNIKNEALAQIMECADIALIEQFRIVYLGRNGKITSLAKKLKDISSFERKSTGLLLNEAKDTIQQALITKKNKLKDSSRTWFDPTIPGIKPRVGHLHLVTQAIDEIENTFEKIGFVRARYPEVEWDWFTFGSLNFTPHHPARDNWETFFIDVPPHPKYGPMVLSPHTSSGQVREMRRVTSPPIRMINIAKCYRRQFDISHLTMFHQFEGLVIDKNISIINLKGTLDYFARNYFGKDRVTRLRPYNFPFTEPSFEVDISCGVCNGTGKLTNNIPCKLCKSGWLELGGAGMVHPTVLRNGGLDPKKFTGFAFGWGVERVLMMKSNIKIKDIRTLYSYSLSYLTQF